jgi:hypothetical protein
LEKERGIIIGDGVGSEYFVLLLEGSDMTLREVEAWGRKEKRLLDVLRSSKDKVSSCC